MRGSEACFRKAAFLLACVVLALAVVAACPAAAGAQVAPPAFSGFKHTRWTAEDGAPTGIREIAQTPNGYLWLAAADGVYRFDGVTFDRVPAPAGSPMEYARPAAFVLSARGELWVGYAQSAGVAVYRRGHLLDTHMADPPLIVTDMVQTPDGTIWAGSSDWDNRLHRFAAGRWQRVDRRLALPGGSLSSLRVDRGGRLLVFLALLNDARSSSLAVLSPGGNRFVPSALQFGRFPRSAIDRHGNLWVSDSSGTWVLYGADGKPAPARIRIPPVPDERFATLAFDRKGGVWGSTVTAGIFYSPGAGVLRRYLAADGLTSDNASFAFADREGNIWIGGASGLDQFKFASVKREPAIPQDPIDGHRISGSADGNIYVTSRGAVYLIQPGKPPRPILRTGSDLYSMCAARAGGVWVVRASRIVRIRGASSAEQPAPPGGAEATSCAEDRRGRLWLGLGKGTLAYRDAMGWHDLAEAAVGRSRVVELVAAPAGDILLRTVAGAVWLIDADSLAPTRLPIASGGSLSMIAPGLVDSFVSGAAGLWRVRGAKAQLLDRRRFPWLSQLRGIVQTAAGDSWLLGGNSISRLSTTDLNRAFVDPAAPLGRRVFDANDGWGSTPQQTFFAGPQSAAGADGRVWFTDRVGAVYIDAQDIPRNRIAPTVLIRTLAAGGRIYRDPAAVTLPAGTRALELAYTATSLVVPQRVRFRYRLEGVDDEWIDPGTRRLASYANLGPGDYRFRVIAANDDGVWNKTGATLAFTIRPTFFESWPFQILCAFAAAALIWLAYALRLRAVTDRLRAHAAERADERERIARELHDTLLQSVQMLTLRFQLALDYLPAEEPAKPVLEAAIDRADQVIAEGRDRVRDLRTFEEYDIEKALCDSVARQAFGADVETWVASSGTPRPLAAVAFDEIVRIANEAIFNIRRHAGAGKVAVEIGYDRDFTVRIADDGAGIDPEVLSSGARDGHFGLPGMRERARKLRGDLAIGAGTGGGTEVVLTIPGRIAYKAASPGFFARFRSPA
ncbi:MAG: triple tyrosine motif-containing protein [Candidatus Andeanibacterium colombiense]|uniref:Triple tyrosine motif-containing protein n=1 Tax=Candidatus Andeanibacterium colombiense TaxID=3121345 RepID=A0AAJ5X623_9SPHN|nr:MAG: triple tyrosine motif-containing protein [Sphingomonadaceae bacterium]